jgi:hypothetical protein
MTEDTFQTRYQQLTDLRTALQTAFGEMTAEDLANVAMLAQVAATVVVPLLEERNTLVRDLAAANEDLAEVRAQCAVLAKQCEVVAARLSEGTD